MCLNLDNNTLPYKSHPPLDHRSRGGLFETLKMFIFQICITVVTYHMVNHPIVFALGELNFLFEWFCVITYFLKLFFAGYPHIYV